MFRTRHPELVFGVILFGGSAVIIAIGALADWADTTFGWAFLAWFTLTMTARGLLEFR